MVSIEQRFSTSNKGFLIVRQLQTISDNQSLAPYENATNDMAFWAILLLSMGALIIFCCLFLGMLICLCKEDKLPKHPLSKTQEKQSLIQHRSLQNKSHFDDKPVGIVIQANRNSRQPYPESLELPESTRRSSK